RLSVTVYRDLFKEIRAPFIEWRWKNRCPSIPSGARMTEHGRPFRCVIIHGPTAEPPELMDTCSRLEEPEGVRWKDVNVGRLRTTTSGKQLIWSCRVAARSDRWPRNLACAIPYCGAGWSNVGRGGSRRQRSSAPQRRRRCPRSTK